MTYLNSGDIGVFPATRRANDYQLESRRFTEESVTRLTNMVVDKNYVITPSWKDLESDGDFEFVIQGYYFIVKKSTLLNILQTPVLTPGKNNLFAKIKYAESTSGEDSFKELEGDGTEESSSKLKYMGVSFSTTPTEEGYDLWLITRSGQDFVIPPVSQVRFSEKCLSITEIDGGIIQ